MTLDVKKDVCFVGLGNSPQCWYRVALPAMKLGCDWCGLVGEPPKLRWATGMVGGESKMPALSEYKIVVIQQPAGKGWMEMIDVLQKRGVIVVYETDDYVHSIKSMKGEHDYYEHFDQAYLAEAETAMKQCDALIASTEWIAGNYSHFNKAPFVCRNGIDHRRYQLTKPPRPTVNIGWSGGTGHNKVVIPWFQEAAKIMRSREFVNFVSIGQPFADAFERWFGPERALSIPWTAIETYPGAMTMFDIALAPAGRNGFFKGKSDLRWLEAAALGIPVVGDPEVYPEIVDGVTGFTARRREEAASKIEALVDDPGERLHIGRAARDYVLNNRTIEHMVPQWAEVFEELVK
jgi:glycosyltransferase involved in cell wall biosynthesis